MKYGLEHKNSTHGFSKSRNKYKFRFYKKWRGMFDRCYNRNDKAYKNWGARGIKICKKWHKFENFRDDMYVGYVKHVNKYGFLNSTLDRIDTNRDYKPLNCKWSTQKQQLRNQRRNVILTFMDKSQCISAWGEELGICRKVLEYRIRKRWSVKQTLTVKPYKGNKIIKKIKK
jgi:hypothetical protein